MYCTVTKLLGDWVIASKLHYEIRYNCTDRFATLQLAWDGEGKLAPIAIQSKDLVGVPWCCTCVAWYLSVHWRGTRSFELGT